MLIDIRAFDERDWPQVWTIIRAVVHEGESFAYDPAMTENEARALWIERPPGLTIIAGDDGGILGTAKMGANRPGPGSHVATASFMVAADVRGRGVGRRLCMFAIDWARAHGFAAMQFNAVAESNSSAFALYERLGFRLIGTVPRAFAHPSLGRVGLHVMHLEF